MKGDSVEEETSTMTRRSIFVENQDSDNPQTSTIQGMRGKMSSNCLWHACKALFVGLLLFSIGAIMSTLGFQADGLLDMNSNMTETRRYVYGEARTTIKFSKLSYAGPIVMGVGGFIIVATCVMTFEARDSAAKVGPAAYSGTRNLSIVQPAAIGPRYRSTDVRSVASQTTGDPLVSAATPMHIFDKRALLETFRKFSRTIRTGSTSTEETFHRSPSAPSLLDFEGRNEGIVMNAAPKVRRASALPKMKTRVPPALKNLRQAMSVDCPTSPVLSIPGSHGPGLLDIHRASSALSPRILSSSLSLRPENSSSMAILAPSHAIKSRAGRSVTYRSPSLQVTSLDREEVGVIEESPPHSSTRVYYSQISESHDKTSASPPKKLTHSPVVHFHPATVELHLPNGSKEAKTNGAASDNEDSQKHFARSLGPTHHKLSESKSLRHDNTSTSPSLARSKFRSESARRPALMRQMRIEQPEIIAVPDSDEEPILEEAEENV